MKAKVKRKLNFKRYHLYLVALAIVLMISAFLTFCSDGNSSTRANSVDGAVSLFDSGKHQEAIVSLETILKDNPGHREAFSRLAMYYYQTQDYDKFLALTLNAEADSAIIYNMMANVYSDRNDYVNAEKYFKEAIAINPRSSSAYVSLASYYQKRGSYDSALATLEQGLVILPNSSVLLSSAASVCLKVGNRNKAAEYANRILANDAGNSQAKAILLEAR